MKPCSTNNSKYINENQNKTNGSEIFDKEYRNDKLHKLYYGDVLYIIGRIWIEALKTALVGAKFNLIPVVQAAKPEETPKRPPKMKYKDLPLYECPHLEYKDYIENNAKCPDANVKILHTYLLPFVKKHRQKVNETFCVVICSVKEKCNDTCSTIRRTKKQIKEVMRDPDNLIVRQVVVAAGGVTGYLLGGGGGIPRRLFSTTLGFLSAGALCFPKETDDVFRDMTYYTGKVLLNVYNIWCDKGVSLRERLPCEDDLPPPVPAPKEVICLPK